MSSFCAATLKILSPSYFETYNKSLLHYISLPVLLQAPPSCNFVTINQTPISLLSVPSQLLIVSNHCSALEVSKKVWLRFHTPENRQFSPLCTPYRARENPLKAWSHHSPSPLLLPVPVRILGRQAHVLGVVVKSLGGDSD